MGNLHDDEIIEQLEAEIERLNGKIDGMYTALSEARQSSANAWEKLGKIEEIMRQLNEF